MARVRLQRVVETLLHRALGIAPDHREQVVLDGQLRQSLDRQRLALAPQDLDRCLEKRHSTPAKKYRSVIAHRSGCQASAGGKKFAVAVAPGYFTKWTRGACHRRRGEEHGGAGGPVWRGTELGMRRPRE